MTKLRSLLVALLVAIVAPACSGGVSGSGFSMVADPVPGVRSRCHDPGDTSCMKQAEPLGRRIATALGPPFEGEVVMRPGSLVAPPGNQTITIHYDWDPATPWKAVGANGQQIEGRTKRLSVELAPLLDGADAYAAVEADVGTGYFLVPRELAAELFEILYIRR